MFFTTEFTKKQFFTLPVVHAKKIVRSSPDGVEGTSGVIFLCAIFEAVGANAFCNFWLPFLTPCETRLLDLQKKGFSLCFK